MKILIIDDNDDFRRQLVRSLNKRGYSCLQANSYETLKEVISEYYFSHAIIDLRISTNYAADQSTGIDCLKLIKQSNPDAKCIMLSGYGTISTTVESINLGASNFLTKPVGIDEILEALDLKNSKDNLLNKVDDTDKQFPSLSQVEWEHINKVLNKFSGNISKAATALKMHRRTLQRKLQNPPKIK